MSSIADSKWPTFAGGVLLGSAVVAGGAFVALKYRPNLLTAPEAEPSGVNKNGSGVKRRITKPSSPMARQGIHGGSRRSLANGSGDNGIERGTLSRTETDLYYEMPRENAHSHSHAGVDNHSHSISNGYYSGPTTTPDKDPRNTLPFSPIPNPSLTNLRRAGSSRPPIIPSATTDADGPAGPSASSPGSNTATDHGGGHLLSRQETYSESEAVHALRSSHDTVIYSGPADRSHPGVLHEALRHTAFVPGSSAGAAAHTATNSANHVGGQHLHGGVGGMSPASAGYTPPPSSQMNRYHQQYLNHHGGGGGGGGGNLVATPGTASTVANYGESPSQITTPGKKSVQGVTTSQNGNVVVVQQAPQNGGGGGGGQANNPITTADALATEGRIIEDAALHEQYSRVILPEPASSEETEEVSWLLQRALDARRKWLFTPVQGNETLVNLPEIHRMHECIMDGNPFAWVTEEAAPLTCEMVNGVMQIKDASSGIPLPQFAPPGTAHDFFSEMHWLLKISSLGHVRSFTHNRLQLLEQKFNLHVMLNADKEFLAQKSAPHRDFYNVRKVDTHVHHSACMHQKHLLRFIKSKLKKEGDEVVIFRDGKYLTLKEVFESLNLTPYDLSVDTLDVHADKNIFHRFDKFNLKYNPFGQSRLREVFIKQDNLIHGRYLAELTREVFNDLEVSKYQHTEYRISVYGRKPVEWDTLAAWVVQNRLYSDNNMWMIQIPRLYNVYKEQGIIESFQQLLDNLFDPLFEVTLDPNSHPMLHVFLRHVSGFDLVDDESKPERRPNKHMPPPSDWTSKHNPAYAYYAYYMYANLYTLNRLREARGFNTFSLRPHAGEAGDLDHLVSTFFLAENIAHGINLRKSPCLQYLYYAAQVGLCMSPLSNNSLFLDYHKNPFPQFFARGLSVSLSTDDPLQIHLTREPLVEEYSVAAQVWKLSGTDLCEVARNSVLHCGFPGRLKQHWVHTEFWREGPEGNNIQKTNVPALRMIFRKDCHSEEVGLLASGAAAHEARVKIKETAALLAAQQD
ncbi:hypothetical protein Ndes2526B_g07318 [Nannochloris sp. 'desiccata']|nr:hypothetical protein KSW81_004666 [Chlorella desiccata (nom. nud.)]KAH7618380.1 putative AMP deaminase [Chlorella desiccata (nom. nud.)]